jgi:hypothetical protein
MTERITEFKGDYAFLSNFSPHEVVYKGFTYKTAEHAYQAAKCLMVRDQRAIMDCETPGQAKRLGKKVKWSDDFERHKIEIMFDIVHAKFAVGCESHTWPLWWTLAGTGDAELIEGNVWHDNFWGVCSCSHCLNFETTGQNMLGKILMKVREEIDGENRR